MATQYPPVEFNGHTSGVLPLPARVTWDEEAPAWTADPEAWIEDGLGWDAWVRHLKRRSLPKLPRLLAGTSLHPMLWALPSGLEGGETTALVEELARFAQKPPKSAAAFEGLLRNWLQAAPNRPRDAAWAVECVAWSYVLPVAAPAVSSRLWWHAFDLLWQTARQSINLRGEGDPLIDQYLAGELPFVLGRLFPEIEDLSLLAEPGLATICAGLQTMLADDGYPLAAAWDQWRPLWACWTRVRAWGRKKQPVWDELCESRYKQLLAHSLRATRKDGTQSLQQGAGGAWRADLFDAALSLAGGRKEMAAAQLALPGGDSRVKYKPGELPRPAHEAATSRMAVLRRNWSADSDMLAVDFRGVEIQFELVAGRDVLWSGPWKLNISVDDRPVAPSGPWKSVCWFSDKDVDYLELEAPLMDGLIVQRQMLLARNEQFLLLGDGILGSQPRRLAYASTLPLRPGITFTPAKETREGFLAGRKRRAVVLPLALPEWRADSRGGELLWTDDGLQLRQTAANAASLFAPLLFDLSPRRLEQPLTWRRLTVAEQRNPVAADQGVAFRAQAGGRQWIVYRSLNGRVNRTFIGANVTSEFFCGRFTRGGLVRPLLEIE
ncbi:MAG: hypothetical protein AB7O62_18670 [Pirellulales bacterium]